MNYEFILVLDTAFIMELKMKKSFFCFAVVKKSLKKKISKRPSPTGKSIKEKNSGNHRL